MGAVVLAGCLAASLGLNIYQMYQASVQNRKVNSFIDGQLERQAREEAQENTYQEDGFVVGDEYEIRSTAHISDAYKSGDDSQLSGDAVCVGYATTFRLFMNMLGMDVHIVHNDYHSWDLVEIEDGQWYHVDIYSDIHGSRFGNFNMTDDICKMGHNWDGSALPVADSVKYSPAVQNSVELNSLTDVPAQYKKDMDEGRYAVYYRFKTPLTGEDMEAADFLVRGIDSALYEVIDGWHYFQACWYPGEGDENILSLTLEKNEEPVEGDPGYDADSPEIKR